MNPAGTIGGFTVVSQYLTLSHKTRSLDVQSPRPRRCAAHSSTPPERPVRDKDENAGDHARNDPAGHYVQ